MTDYDWQRYLDFADRHFKDDRRRRTCRRDGDGAACSDERVRVQTTSRSNKGLLTPFAIRLPPSPSHLVARLLIVRLSAIGDVIHGMPIACALRERFPEALLAWVVEQRAADVLEGHRRGRADRAAAGLAEFAARPSGGCGGSCGPCGSTWPSTPKG